MIIASVVSAVQMLINAYAFGLYQSLGIFIPLIVTNCIVVGRAEAFAAKKGPWLSALDGFSIGMGATGAMFVLGSLREILGNGTLFDGADSLLGGWAKVLRVEIFHTDSPFLLAMLPPGAFIGLGLMLAVKYLIDEKMKKRRAKPRLPQFRQVKQGKSDEQSKKAGNSDAPARQQPAPHNGTQFHVAI